jgi:uncharacterized tellurite resistance protein B-like protein
MQRLRKWIERHLGEDDGAGIEDPAALNLAVAVLMVEVLRADYSVAPDERRQVADSLGRQLGLGDTDCVELVALAERRVDEANDLYQFTSQVNRACTDEEKLRLVEQLWRVALADSVVHKYEEHVIRRIADLLHVPHRAFIAAKLRAEADARA